MAEHVLPVGWIETTLGEAFQWGSGGTPKRTTPEYYGGGIPWAVIGDLNDAPIGETQNSITPLGLQNSSARVVPVGSVLLAMYGSIGKLGIASTELATNQAIAFTHTGLVNNRYLFWYLRASRNELITLGKGDTQSNISQTVLKAFPFLLAPLPEQRRIVMEIETQFTRLDASVAALRRTQANLKRYRASVLRAACSGELVPTEAELARAEGREYEQADVLLERILVERRARWESQEKRRGKYKEPATPDTSDLPTLPEGWGWATLGQIGDLKGGVTKGQQRKDGQAYRELRVANVQRGYLDLTTVKTISVPETTIDQLKLVKGDVLFNEGGDRDKLGRGWVWDGEIAECIHQNHVFRARMLTGDVLPKFVSWWGNSFGKDYFERTGKQTTNLASINLAVLTVFPVPLPPLPEQQHIVVEVERRMSVIQQAEAAVEASLQRADRLRQSILKRAFAGELVPQDPNDEPASVLLERIRAQREAEQAASASKKRPVRRRAKATAQQLALEKEPA